MTKFANYFDYAAATPLLPEAIKAMQPFFSDRFYNPAALYLTSRDNRMALDEFRAIIARGLGARPTEVIFTAGGTEANNLAINGIMQVHPKKHLILSAIEHDSVFEPAKQYSYSLAKVDKQGIVDISHLKQLITNDTVLVSITYASNEVGSIQPIKDISELIKEVLAIRKAKGVKIPLYFHSDACQAANYLDMQVAKLGVDLLTINAGKIYGPKQCGALYMRTGTTIKPQILGGGQERGFRSGTENLANIAGFATAWATVRQGYHAEAKRLGLLRDEFIAKIGNKLPAAVINGPKDHKRLANNIHLTIPGQDNERLLMMLDEAGFIVATGSACSAASTKPSRVLSALGISGQLAKNSLRITLGRYTTQKSLMALADKLIKICTKNHNS